MAQLITVSVVIELFRQLNSLAKFVVAFVVPPGVSLSVRRLTSTIGLQTRKLTITT